MYQTRRQCSGKVIAQTLNIWMSDEVKKSCKEGVGCGIGPSKVQVYQMHCKLHHTKRGAINSLLKTLDVIYLHILKSILVSALHPGVKVSRDDLERSFNTFENLEWVKFFIFFACTCGMMDSRNHKRVTQRIFYCKV